MEEGEPPDGDGVPAMPASADGLGLRMQALSLWLQRQLRPLYPMERGGRQGEDENKLVAA